MSLDPEQRLEALRREVLAESPATPPPPDPAGPPPVPGLVDPAGPAGASDPGASVTPSGPPSAARAPAAPPADARVERALTPPPTPAALPSARPSPPPALPPAAAEPATAPPDGDGWDLPDLRAILADTALSTWIGVGLLAVGGYMILSGFVPWVGFLGNLVILGAGIVLLAQHFLRGSGSWALYAGALLTGLGAARLLGDILPGRPAGLSALGIGVAFLAIGYLRHSQAGGYGWQGLVGAVFTGLGAIQMVLGLLPGAPGILDLVVPALLIGAGALIVIRTRSTPAPRR